MDRPRYLQIASATGILDDIPRINPKFVLNAFNLDSVYNGITHQEVEFLGDAILRLITHRIVLQRGIWDWWNYLPDLASNQALADFMDESGLIDEIIGIGNLHRREKNPANVFEALVGYLYIGLVEAATIDPLEEIQHWLENRWRFGEIVEEQSGRQPTNFPLPEGPPLAPDSQLRIRFGLTSPEWDIIPGEYLEWIAELIQNLGRTRVNLSRTLEEDIWRTPYEAMVAYTGYGESLVHTALIETLLFYSDVKPKSMTELHRMVSDSSASAYISRTILSYTYGQRSLQALQLLAGALDWYLVRLGIPNSYELIRNWLQDEFFDPEVVDILFG